MELWIYLIIIVIIADIALGILDYNLLHKLYKDPETPTIIACLFFLPVFIVFLFLDFQFNNILAISLGMISGFLIFLSSYLYSLAIAAKIPPGTTLGIYKIQMVFAFIVGVYVLGETLNLQQLIGHGIIFACSILLSLGHVKTINNPKKLLLPFIGAIFASSAIIISDLAYSHMHFSTVFGSLAFGWFLGAPVVMLGNKNGKKFCKNIGKNWKKYLIIGGSVECINIVVTIAANLALKLGPLSLVIFLKETYVAFLILISMIFGYYYPQYFPDGGKKISFTKLGIVIIMLLGVYFAVH